MSERHFFASANTADGVFGYLDKINLDGYTYVLKGSSGSGKSSIMRRVGEHFANLGEDVEFIHCSLDPQSLDGVRIVNRGVAIVDGTHPHVTEPSLAGVTGRYVDLTEYLNPSVIEKGDEIKSLVAQKKQHLDAVKIALSEINKIHADIEKLYAPYMDFKRVRARAEKIIEEIVMRK